MTHITVRLSEPLWRQVGKKEIAVELAPEATVADLVALLGDQYPGLRSFLTDPEMPPLVVRANELAEQNTLLVEGDSITFVLAIAGG